MRARTALLTLAAAFASLPAAAEVPTEASCRAAVAAACPGKAERTPALATCLDAQAASIASKCPPQHGARTSGGFRPGMIRDAFRPTPGAPRPPVQAGADPAPSTAPASPASAAPAAPPAAPRAAPAKPAPRPAAPAADDQGGSPSWTRGYAPR